MADYKKGDMVWVLSEVLEPDDDGTTRVRFEPDSEPCWMPNTVIRPDAPAPAELDDVAVLRRACQLIGKYGDEADALTQMGVAAIADRIEAARRVPTPLEALKDVITAYCGIDGVSMTKAVEAARRAIAAEEAKGNM